MGGFANRLFGNEPLFLRERASTTAAGVGTSNTSGSFNEDGSGAISVEPQPGPAGDKLKLTKKSIPDASNTDEVTSFIKQLRAQYPIRVALEEVASYLFEGFRIKPAPKQEVELKKFLYGTGIYSKVWKIGLELISSGWCVVYVSENDKVLPGITVLHNVSVRRGVDGLAHVYLQLSSSMKDAIKKNSKAYPKYWLQQIDNQNGIDITRVHDNKGRLKQGGAYFISVEPDGENIFPISPLYPALSQIIDTARISEAATNIIDFLKLYMLMVTVGNKDGQDLQSGRPKAIPRSRIDEIGRLLSAGYKTGAAVSPADININHVVPEKDPYLIPHQAADHELKAAERIAGTPSFEDAKNEGTARYLGLRLMPKLDVLRNTVILQQFVLPFLADMADRYPMLVDAYPIWGPGSLLDVRTAMERMKAQLATGGCSIQYLNEILDADYDFAREMTRKEYESGFEDTVGMIWEPTQGISDKQLNVQKDAGQTTEPPIKTDKRNSPLADKGGRPTN